jgi:Mlc titration factor MtfA (ptsG expression regulator)
MSLLGQAIRKLLSWLPWGSVRLPTDPIPTVWPELVARQVPLVARLSAPDQERIYRLMQLFLREVPIEGCAELEVTEEIRVTIAAQACLLLLKMPYPKYTRVDRVLVYPSSFVPKTVGLYGSGQVVRPDVPARGQAWQSGVVILGWDSVQHDTIIATDGDNVVLHEFAHMLDAEDGGIDGMPVLDSASAYRAWAALLSTKFAEHVARVERGERTTLNAYGAENRAEFFAVATEAFFEKPVQLRKDQPDLYALLVDFFKLDPAQQTRPSGAG